MVVKQTDRAQIKDFEGKGTEIFNQIEVKLKDLVNETATCAYQGQNAFDFKTKCTNNSVDFANFCTNQMQQMSQAISAATSGIAQALGGAAITLEPPTVLVEQPTISNDVSVESADDSSLNALKSSVTSIYNEVRTQFNQNLTNMQNLGSNGGWLGPEFDQALADVTTITNNAIEGVDNSQQVMEGDITGQLSALGMGG